MATSENATVGPQDSQGCDNSTDTAHTHTQEVFLGGCILKCIFKQIQVSLC